jgi:HAD superfamily hydrolase (TIGR01509 family)
VTIDAIIFDFDGVIADSEALSNRILAQCLSAAGMPTSYEQSLDLYCGWRWADNVATIESVHGRALPATFKHDYHAALRAASIKDLRPVAGVGSFLDQCPTRNLAVASSSERSWLSANVARFGFAHHFGDHLYSAEGLAHGKPHPDVYLNAAAGIGADPARCLAIEDSPTGVTSAVRAGMRVIGLCVASHVRDGHAEKLVAAGAADIAATYREVAAMLVGANA